MLWNPNSSSMTTPGWAFHTGACRSLKTPLRLNAEGSTLRWMRYDGKDVTVQETPLVASSPDKPSGRPGSVRGPDVRSGVVGTKEVACWGPRFC